MAASKTNVYLFSILLLVFTTLSVELHATSLIDTSGESWVARDGSPIENTDNMKMVKGFGGWLIVTPDKDWAEKWNTPSDTTPYFNEATTVEYGQNLTILTFFINPKVDEAGNIDLTCELKIARPDKTISVNQENIECAKGELQGDPRNIRLSAVVINYSGDAGDPAGEWIIEVSIQDNNGDVVIPLKNSFTLIEGKIDVEKASDANEFQILGLQMTSFYLNASKPNFQNFQNSANKFEEKFRESGDLAKFLLAVMAAKISEKYKWPIQDSFFSDISREIIAGNSDLAKYINNDDEVNPTKLDIWWASYFGTGDEVYLDKIFQYVGEKPPKGDTEKLMVIGAAEWSFKSNCKQHKAVKEFAVKMSQQQDVSESKRKFLIEAIKYAEDKGSSL